jgi:hypothetical protein
MDFQAWDQGKLLRDDESGVCRALVLQWFSLGNKPFVGGSVFSGGLISIARTLYAQNMTWIQEVATFANLDYHSHKTLNYDDGSKSLHNYCNSTDCYLIALSSQVFGKAGHVVGLKKRPGKAFDPNYGITSFDNEGERLDWLQDLLDAYDDYSIIDVIRLNKTKKDFNEI